MSSKSHNLSEVVLFQSDDGKTNIEVQLDHDTVWLSLNQMTELFQRDKSVVSRHLNAILKVANWCGKQLLQKMQQFKLRGGA